MGYKHKDLNNLQLDCVPGKILGHGLQVRIGAVHRAGPAGAGGGAGGGGAAGGGGPEQEQQGGGQSHAQPLVHHSRTDQGGSSQNQSARDGFL